MGHIKVVPIEQFGRQFVPAEYLPPGKDEYYLRDEQLGKAVAWRHLRAHEIEALVKNANTCLDWDSFLVADPFWPSLIKNSEFSGLVRIARLEPVLLEYHDLQSPVGITNSVIVSCDLGENMAVHDVRYLAHYLLGDNVMLLNIDEMHTTNYAKFGNGIVKEGEPESTRIWIDLINETGTRAVMPFDGMLPADAYLWARYRDRPDLLKELCAITQRQFDARRGFYGTVGDGCVIKNSRIIKDVKIGPACYIKGANKLKNLTINSSLEEPSQIGEGVELVNGIIDHGCRIFYGCKAVRFVMGNNAKLKYGARLIHSYLGDNSTVSCCEMLNNLIFPAHEQHHNNSFLTAALVLGQSNLAAGTTIGSNHNSRANDGEIHAGRGFWPGLCVTLKHSSRFASFTLLVKADYPNELDVPLPFSLVSNDPSQDRLLVIPAYWWTHNMYALARNAWKFASRDHRKSKNQAIEFDYLAPDTAEEILRALQLLELWTGRAMARAAIKPPEDVREAALAALGRTWLAEADDHENDRDMRKREVFDLEVLGENMENSRRRVVILNPRRAYRAYRQMLHYYAVKNLAAYFRSEPNATLLAMCAELTQPRQRNWVNLGGQLAPARAVEQLIDDIAARQLKTWTSIHDRYAGWWRDYPRQKQAHALACLGELLGTETVQPETIPSNTTQWKTIQSETWNAILDEAVRIQRYIRDQVYRTRKKDYDNPFRKMVFQNVEEMNAVMGTPEGNDFVRRLEQETVAFEEQIAALKRKVSTGIRD